MSEEKKQQVITLGRLGWSLRRIQRTTGVRRETISAYLKEAGVALRLPRGRLVPAKAANGVTTDPSPSEPAREVIGDPDSSKPANEVTTDFGAESATQAVAKVEPQPGRCPSASACEVHREAIEVGLSRGRNAMAIWQDLVDSCGFSGGYQSVKRFVRKLRGKQSLEACAVIETAPGEESHVDYGTGPMVRDPLSGKYRRTRLFVLTLGYSRKSVRLLVFRSSSQIWAELHEQAFRRLGGCTRVVVLDNLREGVLTPDIYNPTLNPLYRDVLKHYSVVALPCRVAHPDRKGKVESGVGHAQKTPDQKRRGKPTLSPDKPNMLLRPWSRASASKASRKLRTTWTAGKSVGPTRASTALPSARSPPCSPRNGRLCSRCLSSPSVITNMASVRCTWTAAWKSRQPTTVHRRAGSAAMFRCSGTVGMSGC